MNVNFKDSNYLVRYLQSFLYNNYSNSIILNTVYDNDTHNALINYLKLPSVQSLSTASKNILEHFPGLGNYFLEHKEVRSIVYKAKGKNEETLAYLEDIKYNLIEYVKTIGWNVTQYSSPKIDSTSYTITVSMTERRNYFPHEELLSTVNLFNNQFYYNLCIRDNMGQDNIIHENSDYKIAILPCEPGEVFTISHGFTEQQFVVVGTTSFHKEDIIQGDIQLTDVQEMIMPWDGNMVYKASSGENVKNIVIQVPNIELGSGGVRIPIQLGDINFDGVIDEKDEEMLKAYLRGEISFTGKQFVAADITNDKVINNDDLAKLQDYLEHKVEMLGVVWYTDDISYYSSINSGRLLVISGDVVDKYNIPTSKFMDDPWLVHETFFNYLLDRSINPYSNPDDIAHAQALIKETYPIEYQNYVNGHFDDTLRKVIQAHHGGYFNFGFMDVQMEARMIKNLSGYPDKIYESFYGGW